MRHRETNTQSKVTTVTRGSRRVQVLAAQGVVPWSAAWASPESLVEMQAQSLVSEMSQVWHTDYPSIALSPITAYLFICFRPASLLECKLWNGRNRACPVQHRIPSVYPNSRHVVSCVTFVAWMNGWWMDGWSKEIKHVPGPHSS